MHKRSRPVLNYLVSFARQLGVYLAAMIVMKIGVLLLFWIALDHVLLPVASWVLDWMRPWSQVVFVEALFPLTMNVIQVSHMRNATGSKLKRRAARSSGSSTLSSEAPEISTSCRQRISRSYHHRRQHLQSPHYYLLWIDEDAARWIPRTATGRRARAGVQP